MATKTGPKPHVEKMFKLTARTQAIHASQGHPAKFTEEPDQKVPRVNCGPAKPPA